MAKHWHQLGRSGLNFTANSVQVGGSLGLDGPWTALRMLGQFTGFFTAGGTIVAGDAAAIAIGIGVVSTDAAALGATAVPDPAGSAVYPWLFWAEFVLAAIVATPEQTGRQGYYERDFDVRSMRKLKPRESLIVVVEYVDIQGTPPVTVDVAQTRVLVAT